jgi:hypothetical protein
MAVAALLAPPHFSALVRETPEKLPEDRHHKRIRGALVPANTPENMALLFLRRAKAMPQNGRKRPA